MHLFLSHISTAYSGAAARHVLFRFGHREVRPTGNLFSAPLFRATTNILSRSGAEDRLPGEPSDDESGASRFRLNAEAAVAAIHSILGQPNTTLRSARYR